MPMRSPLTSMAAGTATSRPPRITSYITQASATERVSGPT
jgi:hypothetical protein